MEVPIRVASTNNLKMVGTTSSPHFSKNTSPTILGTIAANFTCLHPEFNKWNLCRLCKSCPRFCVRMYALLLCSSYALKVRRCTSPAAAHVELRNACMRACMRDPPISKMSFTECCSSLHLSVAHSNCWAPISEGSGVSPASHEQPKIPTECWKHCYT